MVGAVHALCSAVNGVCVAPTANASKGEDGAGGRARQLKGEGDRDERDGEKEKDRQKEKDICIQRERD